jgi:hypothetical protein
LGVGEDLAHGEGDVGDGAGEVGFLVEGAEVFLGEVGDLEGADGGGEQREVGLAVEVRGGADGLGENELRGEVGWVHAAGMQGAGGGGAGRHVLHAGREHAVAGGVLEVLHGGAVGEDLGSGWHGANGRG